MSLVSASIGLPPSSGQAATMLQLVQQAAGEMGLPVPQLVAGNTATDAVQLLALLNAAGSELQRTFDWQALCTEFRFNTQFVSTTGSVTAGSPVITGIPNTSGLDASYMLTGVGINQDTFIQSVDSATQVTLNQPANITNVAASLNFCCTKYPFPADYDRPIEGTQWDKSRHWQMVGPLTAQQWQFRKSGYISTGPRIGFRNLGGTFQTWPPLASSEYLGFEYVSSNWARASDGSGRPSMTADSDTCIFHPRLMVLALKVKYRTAKGLSTGSANEPGTLLYDYVGELARAKAADGGADRLSMSPRRASLLISEANIPDTGYGL